MAHPQQLLFVKTLSEMVAREAWSGRKILEIGSYFVNGSIRPFFDGADYLGVDLTEGPGVDLVSPGHKLNMPNASFDLTISCECFEHDPHWLETFMNMIRLTRPGGLVVFTCATTGRVEHGTTRSGAEQSPGSQSIGWDYYRNLTESDFRSKVNFGDIFEEHFFLTHRASSDLYFAGVLKGSQTQTFSFNAEMLVKDILEILLQFERTQKRKPRNLRTLFGYLEYLFIVLPLLKTSPDKLFHDYHVFKSRLKRLTQ